MKIKLYKHLPDSPGVYIMRGANGQILYVGKAVNLRRRVSSYFLQPHDTRIEKLVSEIQKIDYRKTDTAIEALILEAELIKKHQPPFNIREKDDTSFLYVEFTKEAFPRVLLVRGKEIEGSKKQISNVVATRPTERHQSFGRGSELAFGREQQRGGTRQSQVSKESNTRSPRYARDDSTLSMFTTDARFGPFTAAKSIREALRILRKIFPYATHLERDANLRMHTNAANIYSLRHDRRNRPCFDYQIGLCPGTCIGALSKRDYAKNIRNLKLFFQGKKTRIIQSLKRAMKLASKELQFEKAAQLRGQLFALKHIQDVAVISDAEPATSHEPRATRIEGYDISNISGTSAVGSMVVFIGNEPNKNEYRKFKIRTVRGSNDVAMMKEVLRRRFGNTWPLPDLILMDGGVPQVHAAREILREFHLKIPVMGIAKGPERKRNDIIGRIPDGIEAKTLIQVRDEAHRFAIAYHKKLRAVRTLQ